VRLCQSEHGNLFLYNGQDFVSVAVHSASATYAKARRRGTVVRHAHPDVPLNRLARIKSTIHITDVRTERSYIERDPTFSEVVDVAGARTLLVVPMLKENELVGAVIVYRVEVRPFTDKQIELVKNFAAQAVIAIENTRLLNELRQRTSDLTESLEQQTATSKVLSVISSSPGDLQPVFASMLENAVRICDAKFGNIYRWQDDALHLVASHNTPPAFAQARRRSPFRRADAGELVINRMLVTKTAIHVADVAAQPGYIDRSDHGAVAAVELGGVRTVLAVPMLR
jgi:two-component system, NtrC family, sensor kinase